MTTAQTKARPKCNPDQIVAKKTHSRCKYFSEQLPFWYSETRRQVSYNNVVQVWSYGMIIQHRLDYTTQTNLYSG